MTRPKGKGALTDEECPIIKALLAKKWRNQDIQNLINIGRNATINGARIIEVKRDSKIIPASNERVDFFILSKKSYDQSTGLNRYDDERLIRAREAMIMAVLVFNSPSIKFKLEQFSMQAVIAWTYLLLEIYKRNKMEIKKSNNKYHSLTAMINKKHGFVSTGIKDNLETIIEIRNCVAHGEIGTADSSYSSIFQACCLNFDKVLCEHFGDQVSLQHELSLALQFSKLNFDQAKITHSYGIPNNIKTLDANLSRKFSDEQKSNLEY